MHLDKCYCENHSPASLNETEIYTWFVGRFLECLHIRRGKRSAHITGIDWQKVAEGE
jgi:hypothetical protein